MRILFGFVFLIAMAALYEGTASATPNCGPGFRLHNGRCRHVLFHHPVYRTPVPLHPVPHHPAPVEPQPH